MKIYVWLCSIMLILGSHTLFSVEQNAQENQQQEEITEEESYATYSLVGKKGDLRMSGSLYYSKVLDDSIIGWRGVFDYYMTDVFSFTGVTHIPFQAKKDIKPYYFSLGMNTHFWHYGDLDFFAGGTAGFTVVQHELASTKGEPTVTLGGGMTLFGTFFTLTMEYQYHIVDYTDTIRGNTTLIELNQHVFAVGVGFRM